MDGYKVGDRVLFGRRRGEQTLGEVVKVNPSRLKVKQLEPRGIKPVGTEWAVPPSLCRPVPAGMLPKGDADVSRTLAQPRPEGEVMGEIFRCYVNLSPENLSCDGELSRTETARRGASLRRRLEECFRELGRRVSENEAYDWRQAQRARNAEASHG